MPVNTVAPPPSRWMSWVGEIYASGRPPVLGTCDIQEIQAKAEQAIKDLSTDAFKFVKNSAGTSSTDAENRRALDRWKLVPRMLVDVGERHLETTIFGVTYPAPVFLAPIGGQGLIHGDGELGTARAAAKVGVPMIVSTVASRSMEDIAEANGPNGHRWFQLYWPHSVELTRSFLDRAKASGYTVLVITVDTMTVGWRPDLVGSAFHPAAHGVCVQHGTSDPTFMARFGLEPRHERPTFPYDQQDIRKRAAEGDPVAQQAMFLGRKWAGDIRSGIFRTWDELQFIREHWDGRIVLKGILAREDAEKAIDMGVDGIVVSNHGGRQVDGSIGALDALDIVMQSPKVCEAQRQGKLTVLFDSGIRNGSDILKALALGAQAVLLGRPYVYGLAVAGEAGVEQMLMQTIADLYITIGLCGFRSVVDVVGAREKLLVKID